MRENIVTAQHYPFPLRNKAYIDQTVMKMTSEVDNNLIPFRGEVRHWENEKPRYVGDQNTQHNLHGKYGY